MTSVSDRKAQLLSRLDDLTARLGAIEGELESHNARDWEELATEREGEEVLEGLGSSGQHEIAMIRAALSRVEAGTYGTCTRCGADITEARLDVLPFTPLCRSCA